MNNELKKYKDIKVVFMGTPEFAVPILKSLIENFNVILVVTQPDKEIGRKRELSFSPIKKVALEHSIEVFQPIKIREDFDRVLEASPDIVITCAYGQIIPKVLLEFPKYKCINVHASLLPKLRGGAPIHHAIIDGYDKTGITIMYMNEKMDEGDIITQRQISIGEKDNVGILHDKLRLLGESLLLETLPIIFENEANRIPQNHKEATYAYNIKREDELLDFSKTSKEIYNKIRGLYPFPISYAVLEGEIIKIIESQIGTESSGIPGEIINLYKEGIGVKCKDKEIIIKKLKPEGKNIMNAQEFINGRKNLKGKIFNES